MSKMICSICGNAFDQELTPHTPFCSQRCQQIDLSRWLGEEYRFPIEGDEDREPADKPQDSEGSQDEIQNGHS